MVKYDNSSQRIRKHQKVFRMMHGGYIQLSGGDIVFLHLTAQAAPPSKHVSL
jgi:hypothetical protein